MKKVAIASVKKNPNFIGSWNIEPISICDDLISYFELNIPKQKIGFNNYLPSIKENYILDICDSNKSLYAENMKAAFLDNFKFKSILLYVLVSFSSIYITTRLFYKNHN